MTTKNSESLTLVVLFALSMLLGVVLGVLRLFTIIGYLSTLLPYLFAFAIFALATAFILVSASLLRNREEESLENGGRGVTTCLCSYVRSIIIGALFLIVTVLAAVIFVLNPVSAAVIFGFLGLFFFFTLFTIAALICCLIKKLCDDPCDC